MWQKVWAKFGISTTELEHHFSGPSFLAWNRMGNLRGYEGPLPQSYIDDQAGAVLLQGSPLLKNTLNTSAATQPALLQLQVT